MRGAFTATSFDLLLEHLNAAISWIEQQGVTVTPTRLARYRRLMTEVIEVAAGAISHRRREVS
jgi:hypothetical protein